MNPFDSPDGIIVAPVGATLSLNTRFRIFFDKHEFCARFIALYENKKIVAVGRISNVIRRYPDGRLETFTASSFYPQRIEEMKSLSGEYAAQMDSEPWYFYVVDEFFPTAVAKDSKFGVPRTRVFSVGDITQDTAKYADAYKLANRLAGRTHPLGGKQ